MSAAAVLVIQAADVARIDRLAALEIHDGAQEKDAVDGLAFVQGIKRTLEQERKAQVDPLNAQVKTINDTFRPYLDGATTAEQRIKAAILDWRERERRRIAAERERVRLENERRELAAQAEQLRLAAVARQQEQAERERVAKATEAAAQAAGFTPSDAAELAILEAADVAPVAPPVVEAPVRLVVPSAPQATVKATLGSATVRAVVNREAIRAAVEPGAREIPGVRIYPVWQFEVVNAAAVPDAYRQEQLAGRRA